MTYYPQIYTQQPMKTPMRSQLDFNNDWANDLFDCCKDTKLCLCAFCCFPCFSLKLDKAAHEPSCTVYGLSCLSNSLVGLAMMRTKLRSVYKIDGSICGDCLAAYFCAPCTALQSYYELQQRGEA